MCIWAAYAGPRKAAEVVHKMIWRSYGIWGGYYSGLVSNDNGKLYYGKTAGDTGVWDEKFNVADFPGNAAIFHSRTPVKMIMNGPILLVRNWFRFLNRAASAASPKPHPGTARWLRNCWRRGILSVPPPPAIRRGTGR